MINLDEFKTGNKKMDDKILKALLKEKPFIKFNNGDLIVKLERTNKYNVAEKEDRTYKDGTVFASKSEMKRYEELLLLEKAGQIKDLKTQVPFLLQESFISKQHGDISHIVYVADFVYTNVTYRKGHEGRVCVEDSKSGVRTKEYNIKRKMFLYKYGEFLFFEV